MAWNAGSTARPRPLPLPSRRPQRYARAPVHRDRRSRRRAGRRRTTTVTTTVLNATALSSNLMAAASSAPACPTELGGASRTKSFTLLPTATSDDRPGRTARPRSANVTFETSTPAPTWFHRLGTCATGPASDIIIDNTLPVTIDNDEPNVPALTLGCFRPARSHRRHRRHRQRPHLLRGRGRGERGRRRVQPGHRHQPCGPSPWIFPTSPAAAPSLSSCAPPMPSATPSPPTSA